MRKGGRERERERGRVTRVPTSYGSTRTFRHTHTQAHERTAPPTIPEVHGARVPLFSNPSGREET